MIGRALVAALVRDGVAVDILSRRPAGRRATPAGARTIAWDPRDPASIVEALRDADGVVNLSGVPVGPLPWTPGRRRAIVESRVGSARTLVEAMRRLAPEERPKVLVNAAGTDGYTGLDAEPATEAVGGATGFLADLGVAWEGAALEAEALGVRVVLVRTSFVLARGNALLQLLALPTRLFVGGPIGSGDQWFSWIHIDDLVAVYRAALTDPDLAGPINATAPEPCRQRDVAAALGRVLHRPAFFRTPAWVVRLAMREASTLILGSRRVVPVRLLERGMTFRYADIEAALRDAL